jgi:hypothetical protein
MHAATLKDMTKMTIDEIAATMNKVGGNYCDHPTVLHYIKTDKNFMETEPLYRRQREEIVRRVNRLYKPDFTTTDAWGNLWEGVNCAPLI